MGFDPPTYLPSACKHCYNLFTCMAVTTLPFSMPPQSTLPDGADTTVLRSTDTAFLCPLSVLFPQQDPHHFSLCCPCTVMFLSPTSPALYLCLHILISIGACSQPLPALWAHPKPCLNICPPSVTPISSLLMLHLKTHKPVYSVSPLHRIIMKFPG